MQMKKVTLFGKASQSNKYLSYENEDLAKSVLLFLQKHSIPIASSCKGRAACHKCKINDDLLSCDISLEEFLKEHGEKIEVDYL